MFVSYCEDNAYKNNQSDDEPYICAYKITKDFFCIVYTTVKLLKKIIKLD